MCNCVVLSWAVVRLHSHRSMASLLIRRELVVVIKEEEEKKERKRSILFYYSDERYANIFLIRIHMVAGKCL